MKKILLTVPYIFFYALPLFVYSLNACAGGNSSESTVQAPVSQGEEVGQNAQHSETTSMLNAENNTGNLNSGDEFPAASGGQNGAAKDTIWNKANLTWYTSWPDPGSEECIEYNGCTWAGYFAGIDGQQTEAWVSEHNIIAVHEKDWETYKLKTFRLRQNGHTVDAVVYDMCSDSDCDGCCTENAGSIGFLIDIESYTKARFNNQGDGVVEWTCLNCD